MEAAVPRDALASWDFEDVRDFYVREIFGVDPMLVRYADPARALDLGRAAMAHVFETVFGHWRRADVDCSGALVLSGSDLWPVRAGVSSTHSAGPRRRGTCSAGC